MADSDNFKDIFAAIDEINLPKEKKKKKLEESKSIDQEKVSKPKSPNKNETIPLSTEQLIKQAEKQLNPSLKVKNISSEKPKRKTKEASLVFLFGFSEEIFLTFKLGFNCFSACLINCSVLKGIVSFLFGDFGFETFSWSILLLSSNFFFFFSLGKLISSIAANISLKLSESAMIRIIQLIFSFY